MPRKFKQLTKEERDRLSLLKAQGLSLRDIADLMGRNVGTISRELKRNAVMSFGAKEYLAHRAQEEAEKRQAEGHYRVRLRAPGLRSFVVRMLNKRWSPDRIAGRWKYLGHKAISHEAIYQWIYSDRRDLAPLLLRAHKRRKRARKRVWSISKRIPSRISILQRPSKIQLRRQAGHWEADTMVSSKSRATLQVLVERKTRYARLKKLPAREAAAVYKAIAGALIVFPRHMRRTITYDNGNENVQHMKINKRLRTRSYFCEPMHSWEKGSVENIAGLVRRWLPKKTDFASLSRRDLRKTQDWLNSLPRKCLGYQTPEEAMRASVAFTG